MAIATAGVVLAVASACGYAAASELSEQPSRFRHVILIVFEKTHGGSRSSGSLPSAEPITGIWR